MKQAKEKREDRPMHNRPFSRSVKKLVRFFSKPEQAAKKEQLSRNRSKTTHTGGTLSSLREQLPEDTGMFNPCTATYNW